jgi:hypothetical protein
MWGLRVNACRANQIEENMPSKGERLGIGSRMAISQKFRTPVVYRDKKSGRFVSKSTWKRSKAHGGTRYVRLSLKVRHEKRRELNVLGFDGYVPVVVRSSKQAQLASRHLIAVGRFVGQIRSRQRGDTELLKPFVGKHVGGVEFLTDPDRLHDFADAGLVKLDALYRQNRGGRREK